MTLPRLHSRITPTNTYPDRVRVKFQYQLPEGTRYEDVMAYFHDLGFVTVNRKPLLQGTVEGNTSGFLFDVMATYAQRFWTLHVYVDVNALRCIHLQDDGSDDEETIGRVNNWLPRPYVRRNNQRVWNVADELIWEAEERLTEIVTEFVRLRGDSTLNLYRGVSISLLEVTVDYQTRSPHAAIDAIAPNFGEHVRHLHTNDYGTGWVTYETQQDNARMLHGYRRRNERYKVYPKTNRRVRLECEIKGGAFGSLGIKRDISAEDNSFQSVFEAASTHCVTVFNQLTEAVEGDGDASPADFVLEVGRVCRDRERARSIINIMAQAGRITSDFGYSYLRPLIRNGLLEQTGHGIYGPARRWRVAVRRLRQALGNFRREVVR